MSPSPWKRDYINFAHSLKKVARDLADWTMPWERKKERPPMGNPNPSLDHAQVQNSNSYLYGVRVPNWEINIETGSRSKSVGSKHQMFLKGSM